MVGIIVPVAVGGIIYGESVVHIGVMRIQIVFLLIGRTGRRQGAGWLRIDRDGGGSESGDDGYGAYEFNKSGCLHIQFLSDWFFLVRSRGSSCVDSVTVSLVTHAKVKNRR